MVAANPPQPGSDAPSPQPFQPGLFTVDDEGLGPTLIVGRCERCGAHSFPRREMCDGCGPGPAVETATLPGDGVVYASTRVHVPSPVQLASPYSYGYVDLLAAPLRVFALFSSSVEDVPAPGTRVRMVVEPLAERPGARLAYKFVPVEGVSQ